MRRYPFLSTLLSPFNKRHRDTLSLVIAAIAVTGQARSFAIATTLARWLSTRLDSAVNRFYRLLRNDRVDYLEFVCRWADLLCRSPERHLLVAVDWTEWHHELRMLTAAVVTGSRAIPLYAQAFHRIIRQRSQNARENTFARVLADALRRAGLTATILCDRGFRRVSWLRLLDDLRLSYVVRLMDDVTVETSGVKLPLADILLSRGRIIDLGLVPLRGDGAVHSRIVGYWAPHAHAPWWIATNLPGPARSILRLYDRRMTIEEQFRDIKGSRFGARLFWTHFRDPDALSRFVMLLAPALLIWLLSGLLAARAQPSLRLLCKRKGPRQSLVTIGLRLCALDRPPDYSLAERVVRRLIPLPSFRNPGLRAPGGK